MNLTKKQIIGLVLGVVLGVAIPLLVHPADLSFQGVCALGILAGAIAWWVFGVFPEYVTAIVAFVFFVGVCGVPFSEAFRAFSSPVLWIVLVAYALGLGMKTTGLMARMAKAILRVFPHTYAAQMVGFMAAGTLIGPLVPSMAAKVGIMAPLAMSVSDGMGYERSSREARGFLQSVYAGVQTAAPAFISASAVGYAFVGLLPADLAARFDMLHWFLMTIPLLAVSFALNSLFLVLLHKPKKGSVSPDQRADSFASPGPMSRDERIMSFIIAGTILMWVTEGIHGISSVLVGLAALAALFVSGIISREQFRSGIAWDSLVFIGLAIGLAGVFESVALDQWLIGAVGPAFASLAGNPYLLLLGVCLFTIAARFLIVSQVAFLSIFLVALMPLASSLGINIWVIGIAAYAVINSWVAPYQNAVFLVGYYAIDGDRPSRAAMVPYAVLFLASGIVGVLASVPYWQFMGVFYL